MSSQQPSVAAIVEQFYPKSLTEVPDESYGRQQCFAVYDADGSGAPLTIVAAYSNHSRTVIRVLRARGGEFVVVAEQINLALENKLTVRFAGDPSSQLLLIIKSKKWRG